MNADGSSPVQLTSGPGDDWLAAWSPDGRRIAFVSNRTGNIDVHVVNADGSNRADVTQTPYLNDWLTSQAWSPDGRSITYRADPVGPPAQDYLILSRVLAAVILQSILVVVLVLYALAAGRLPFGGITVALVVGVGMLSFISQHYELVGAAFVAGLVGDVLVRRLRLPEPFALQVLAFCLPAVLLGAELYQPPLR